jgi:hypothetical protein
MPVSGFPVKMARYACGCIPPPRRSELDRRVVNIPTDAAIHATVTQAAHVCRKCATSRSVGFDPRVSYAGCSGAMEEAEPDGRAGQEKRNEPQKEDNGPISLLPGFLKSLRSGLRP